MTDDSASQIAAIIAEAQSFTPMPETLEETVARLAGLSVLEYEVARQGESSRLGIRVGVLDRSVSQARSQPPSFNQAGTDFLRDTEPWPEPVDGAKLLDELTSAVRTYLVLSDGCAEVMALWVVAAHAHDCFDISALLAITSPTPACGKTTSLTLLGALVPRPCPAANITHAALFRSIEKWQPTLLIDEADTFLQNSDELRGVLNSGHQRANAFVIRTVGDDHEPRQFRTWAPKVIAQIGKLPPTLASRAIHVELRHKTANENVKTLRTDRLDGLRPLGRRAARWAKDQANNLRAADPKMPPALSNRAADNWRPLLAIADDAGGDWPERARRIAVLHGADRSELTIGIMLLSDLKDIFDGRGETRMSSTELVTHLTALEARPWPEWYQGKPVTARQIARLLDPFGVAPATIRTPEGTFKGYRREDFDDAFARYLAMPSVTP